MLSTCNRTEIYVVAEQFHGAYADLRNFLVRAGAPAARGLRRPPLRPLRRRRRRPPLRGGRRARLRGASARPRSSARCAHAWERAQDEGTAGSVAQPAVPPRPRGRQAGPHRDRHRPPHRLGVARPRWPWPPSGSARSTAAASSCSVPARWARAWSRALGRGRRRRRRASPTAPGSAAVELADARRRPGRPPGRPRPTSLAEVDLLLTVHRRHVDHARARRPRRGHGGAATAGRCSSSTSPCPATSIRRPPSSPGVTLLDMDDLRAFAEAGLAERRREVGRGARA